MKRTLGYMLVPALVLSATVALADNTATEPNAGSDGTTGIAAGVSITYVDQLTGVVTTADEPASPFYFGFEAGLARTTVSRSGLSDIPGISYDLDDDALSITMGFLVGYRFNETFALEMGLISVGQSAAIDFTYFDEEAGVEGPGELSTGMFAFQLSAIAGYDVTEKLHVFGKVGVSLEDHYVRLDLAPGDVDDNWPSGMAIGDAGTFLTYGLGASYELTPRWALRTQIEHFKLGEDTYSFTCGLTFSP